MPEVVELCVVMYCEACADSVKRVVKRIPGVESYKIDYVEQKVTVVGNVDREDVWRRIHRTGRHVTLIPKPVPPPKVEEPKKVVVEEVVEEKKEETKVEKTEETRTIEKKPTEITVEEVTIEDTKAVESKEEVKVIEVKEEVATVVETHEDDEEEEEEYEEEGGEEEEEEEEVVVEMKKEPEKAKPMPKPEWVPMFVTAPYYTLPVPSRYY